MRFRFIFASLLAVLMVSACATHHSVLSIDTPAQHVSNGFKFLQRGMFAEAEREFTAASERNPYSSTAFSGLAIIRAHQGHYSLAHHLLSQGMTYAKGNEEQFVVHVSTIRAMTEEKSKGWVEQARTSFERAVRLDPGSMEPYYFMGVAYKESYNFLDAEEMFQKAAQLSGSYEREAKAGALLMNTIQKFPPQTSIGKKVALVERVSRGEIAALFVEEFELEKWLPHEKATKNPLPQVKDIVDNPDRGSIEAVIQMGIAGLGVYPDGTFKPDEPVTRADLAVMIQDIIIQSSGRKDLAVLYKDHNSPFFDLDKGHACFNAAMLVVSWGLIETRVSSVQQFDPLGPVSGANVFILLYRLKEKLPRVGDEYSNA